MSQVTWSKRSLHFSIDIIFMNNLGFGFWEASSVLNFFYEAKCYVDQSCKDFDRTPACCMWCLRITHSLRFKKYLSLPVKMAGLTLCDAKVGTIYSQCMYIPLRYMYMYVHQNIYFYFTKYNMMYMYQYMLIKAHISWNVSVVNHGNHCGAFSIKPTKTYFLKGE